MVRLAGEFSMTFANAKSFQHPRNVNCCRELGITVCNVPSYGSEAISQNAIALLLELTNRVAHHDAEV